MSNFGDERVSCRFPAARLAGKILSLPGNPSRGAQVSDRNRFYRPAEGLFSPGGEVFPCVSRAAGKMLGGGADCGVFDLAADERLVFAEIGREAAGQPARGLVIGLFIRPSAARVEYLVRDLGAALRHEQAEIGVLP